MTAKHSHRKTLTGIVACTIAYFFVLQATLAATLTASMPLGSSPPLGEICHSQPADPDTGNSTDAEHVKAASHCLVCLIPAFRLLLPPMPTAVVVRAALGIVYEPLRPARIELADARSPHRARAPPAII